MAFRSFLEALSATMSAKKIGAYTLAESFGCLKLFYLFHSLSDYAPKTLLGSNISPTSQHFWVDDLPFLLVGYVVVPWKVPPTPQWVSNVSFRTSCVHSRLVCSAALGHISHWKFHGKSLCRGSFETVIYLLHIEKAPKTTGCHCEIPTMKMYRTY